MKAITKYCQLGVPKKNWVRPSARSGPVRIGCFEGQGTPPLMPPPQVLAYWRKVRRHSGVRVDIGRLEVQGGLVGILTVVMWCKVR